MNIGDMKTDAAAAVTAGVELAKPTLLETADGAPFLVVADGHRLESLKRFDEERREYPERRVGTATTTTLESFVAHVKRFADPGSAVFAWDEPSKPALTAVYDYHEATGGKPRHGVHRCRYAFPLSHAWLAWRGLLDTETLSQAALATFLDDHLEDVIALGAMPQSSQVFADKMGVSLAGPDTLVQLTRGLEINVTQTCVSVQNPSTGEARLVYEEQHSGEAGGAVKVPGGFAVAIPVFRGGAPYAIPVRLRYRVRKGTVSFSLKPYRLEQVFADAFGEAVKAVADATNVAVFYGSPE